MKLEKYFVLLFLALGVQNFSYARGGIEGGGGKGVQCGNKIMTLDLYEAKFVHHFELAPSKGSLTDNLDYFGVELAYYISETGFDKSNENRKRLIKETIKELVTSRFQDIPAGDRLPFTPDATLPPLNDGCHFVQIAINTDNGIIYRDRKYWDLLSPFEQAALILHEGLFGHVRSQGVRLSDDVRYLVGLLFSNQMPEPPLRPLWNKNRAFGCEPSSHSEPLKYRFYAFDEVVNGQSGVWLIFVSYQNIFQYERTHTFIPGIDVIDLYLAKTNFQALVHHDISQKDSQMEYRSFYENGYKYMIRTFDTEKGTSDFTQLSCALLIQD